MSRDFFLLNRRFQIARLCSTQPTAKFAIPALKARAKLPAKLIDFYALIDRICAQTSVDTSAEDEASQAQLTQSQRNDLEEFERQIVSLRFSSDETLKRPAVALIRAIFADAEYFSGLKPLPQYTDAFAYELLFPTWLNLLKAAMLPRADNGKPRLEGKRQGALFEFLGKVPAQAGCDDSQLVGFLTFIASRCDAPQCEDLLQRCADLYCRDGELLTQALASIDADSKNARELKERIEDYLTVKYSLADCGGNRGYDIAYQRPCRRAVPEYVARQLCDRELARDWKAFFDIAHPLRQLINSAQTVTPEFANALPEFPGRTAQLLGLLVECQGNGACKALSPEAQACLATLIGREPSLVSTAPARLEQFARCIASRLENFSEATIKYFCRLFIDDEQGRKTLLASCQSEKLRQQLATQLLDRAGKTSDHTRFLNLLSCITVVSPASNVLEAKTALRTIDAVVSNRSIGSKELSDLLGDLQANHPSAIDYLASPVTAAAGKNPRLASLYLTLNEVSQRFLEVGSVDNFSVVRAKYAKLTNMEFD